MLESILAIGIHLGTYHSNIDEGYHPNNFNPGMYVETVDNSVLGAYFNSDRKSTIYIGKTLHKENFSLMYGLATGYKYDVVPAIIPSYTISLSKEARMRMWWIPKVDSAAEGVHFSIEWRIK